MGVCIIIFYCIYYDNKENFFCQDIILVPWNFKNHWALIVNGYSYVWPTIIFNLMNNIRSLNQRRRKSCIWIQRNSQTLKLKIYCGLFC